MASFDERELRILQVQNFLGGRINASFQLMALINNLIFYSLVKMEGAVVC